MIMEVIVMKSVFAFYQMSSKPELIKPYFNVIGGRLDKSTVSIDTLVRENIDAPSYPSLTEWMGQQKQRMIV